MKPKACSAKCVRAMDGPYRAKVRRVRSQSLLDALGAMFDTMSWLMRNAVVPRECFGVQAGCVGRDERDDMRV